MCGSFAERKSKYCFKSCYMDVTRPKSSQLIEIQSSQLVEISQVLIGVGLTNFFDETLDLKSWIKIFAMKKQMESEGRALCINETEWIPSFPSTFMPFREPIETQIKRKFNKLCQEEAIWKGTIVDCLRRENLKIQNYIK